MMREITAEQLKDGYVVQVAPISGTFTRGEVFEVSEMVTVRQDYVVIGITEHGTYIVEEP